MPIYLKFDAIMGSAKNPIHNGASEIDSYFMPHDGKSISFIKRYDGATQGLRRAFRRADTTKSATLTHANDSGKELLVITFKNVEIVGFKPFGNDDREANSEPLPRNALEKITIIYKGATYKYPKVHIPFVWVQ